MGLLMTAHMTAARNNPNASSVIYHQFSRTLGKPVPDAVAAAILSTGDVHAPVIDARRVIFSKGLPAAAMLLKAKRRVPGFGNSFYRDSVDPAFRELEKRLRDTDEYSRVLGVAAIIQTAKGRYIPPNAAAFTACVAEILRLKTPMEYALFAIPRISSWLQS